LKVKDDERKRELNIMKESYEKKLADIRSSDTSVTLEKQQQWEREKAFL